MFVAPNFSGPRLDAPVRWVKLIRSPSALRVISRLTFVGVPNIVPSNLKLIPGSSTVPPGNAQPLGAIRSAAELATITPLLSRSIADGPSGFDFWISRFRHGVFGEMFNPIFSDALCTPSLSHSVGRVNEALTPSENPTRRSSR